MADTWEWRCAGVYLGRPCNRLLGKFQDLRRGAVMCPRCKTINRAAYPDGAPPKAPAKQGASQ